MGSIGDEYNVYLQLENVSLLELVSKGKEIPVDGVGTDIAIETICSHLDDEYAKETYVFESVQIKKITTTACIYYVVEDRDGNQINIYSSTNYEELE